MAARSIVKISINVQCITGDMPTEEEVVSTAAELYEQCVRVVNESGGRVQRVREWKSED